ncbi:MAG: sulfatase, partial [Lachnospiraceae bacterium]|nr:sulfatase [Lachnospiraceae bacterium]
SCLVSDHYHYWEDGGCTYHNRYSSWKANRGQEGDPCSWDAEIVEYVQKLGAGAGDQLNMRSLLEKQDVVNRRHITDEMDMPQAVTFKDGLDFLERNKDLQNWFLQIETFDPHEPFFTQPQWKELYPEIAEYLGKKNDWPPYDPVRDDSPEDIQYVRNLYAALVSMCDAYLGKVLDFMDAHDMWKDTMLIVNTDHGFLLGEHDWWGKTVMPAYEEISHTPLFIYDPVSGIKGERRSGLTSAIDLPVTILEFFGLDIPKDMQGYSLLPLIRENRAERKAALFGFHGSCTAVTDGEYVYFRAPLVSQENNMYEYTLMPTRMRQMFSVADLQDAELVPPLPNSKGCPVLRTRGHGSYISPINFGTKLYHVADDPRQKDPVDNAEIEARMAKLLKEEMAKADAPAEQFVRLGLEGEITPESILSQRESETLAETPDLIPGAAWTKEAKNVLRAFSKMMPKEGLQGLAAVLSGIHTANPEKPVSYDDIVQAAKAILPKDQADRTVYYMYMISRAE